MQKITGRRLSVVLLSATFLAALGTASLRADDLMKVGIVGSTHGEVTGVTEGHVLSLQAGDPVYLNETVKTGKGGAAQLMFLDRSSLTVTPGSEVKVDAFVYNPDSASGKLSLQGVRGAFRFIGGALSKKDYVTIKTPVSTIGIRGGIVQASIADNGSSAEAIFLYGHDMKVWNALGAEESNTSLFGHGFAMLNNGIQNLSPDQVVQHIQLFNTVAQNGFNFDTQKNMSATPWNAASNAASGNNQHGSGSGNSNTVGAQLPSSSAAGGVLQSNGAYEQPGTQLQQAALVTGNWGQWANALYQVPCTSTSCVTNTIGSLAQGIGTSAPYQTANLSTYTPPSNLGTVNYTYTGNIVSDYTFRQPLDHAPDLTGVTGTVTATVNFNQQSLSNLTIIGGQNYMVQGGPNAGHVLPELFTIGQAPGATTYNLANVALTGTVYDLDGDGNHDTVSGSANLGIYGKQADVLAGTFNASYTLQGASPIITKLTNGELVAGRSVSR